MVNSPMCTNIIPQPAASPEPEENSASHENLGPGLNRLGTTRGQQLDQYGGFLDVLGPQDASGVNLIKPSVEATGVPTLLSDQEFGNVYPLVLQGRMGTPGAVPDHVDRRVLCDLPAGRIACDPDFIGVSFCAVLHDQSHWRQACDRSWAFTTLTASRTGALSQRCATRINESLDPTSIAELHRSYNETKAAYRRVMEQRFAFLKQDTDI